MAKLRVTSTTGIFFWDVTMYLARSRGVGLREAQTIRRIVP